MSYHKVLVVDPLKCLWQAVIVQIENPKQSFALAKLAMAEALRLGWYCVTYLDEENLDGH